MEKRSRQRVRDQVAHLAFGAEFVNEIERARISMMARSSKAPSIGRIQKRKTNFSKSSLSACNARPVQRAAGRFALQKTASLFGDHVKSLLH